MDPVCHSLHQQAMIAVKPGTRGRFPLRFYRPGAVLSVTLWLSSAGFGNASKWPYASRVLQLRSPPAPR